MNINVCNFEVVVRKLKSKNAPTLDWGHLRIFLAVIRHGQLLSAARSLELNHATVARRLDALEASVGAPLFERRPSGTVPTQAGHRLLPFAERIEAELASAVENLQLEESSISGTVRIGAPDGLGNYFLAAELCSLTDLHPRLVLELVPLPRAFSLSKREVDIAIGLDRPKEGRLLISRLTDYTLSLYASHDYIAQHGSPVSPDGLTDHLVITGVEDQLTRLRWIMREHSMGEVIRSSDVPARSASSRLWRRAWA